jgi:hypothetical protein
MAYVEGFGYNQVLPAPDAEVPMRFQRADEAARSSGGEQLRDWDENRKARRDRHAPRLAGH